MNYRKRRDIPNISKSGREIQANSSKVVWGPDAVGLVAIQLVPASSSSLGGYLEGK